MNKKKRGIALTIMLALLMMLFSTAAVLAEGDDHGADAHSESMTQLEEEALEDEEMSLTDQIVNAVMNYLPYIIGIICGAVVIVIIVKLISRGRKPKYKGKH